MHKLTFTLLFVFVVAALAACSGGEKKEDPTPVAEEAEVVQSVERWFSNTLPDAPAEENIDCRYTVVQVGEAGAKYASALTKARGSCKWDELKGQLGPIDKDFPAGNLTSLVAVIDGVEFPAGPTSPKFDCATITITTNKRSFTTYECDLRDAATVTAEKGFASVAEGTPSKSVEEATFRLNSLLALN